MKIPDHILVKITTFYTNQTDLDIIEDIRKQLYENWLPNQKLNLSQVYFIEAKYSQANVKTGNYGARYHTGFILRKGELYHEEYDMKNLIRDIKLGELLKK